MTDPEEPLVEVMIGATVLVAMVGLVSVVSAIVQAVGGWP